MKTLNEFKENLFKYYFLLGKYKSFEAIFSHFDEFNEDTQDELVKMYGQAGQVDSKNNEIKKDIFNSYKIIHSLEIHDFAKDLEVKLQDVLISTDNYLHNIFQIYNFNADDKEFLVSKDELSKIFKKITEEK